MKQIIFIIFFMFPVSLWSYSPQSLTWQKVALEEKLHFRITSIVSTVLKENQYIVDTEVEVDDPGQPNLGGKSHLGPKVSDISLSQSSGDYIAFSKVGLEVPILDKYFDEDKTKLMNLYRFNEAYDLFKNLSSIKANVWVSDKVSPTVLEIVKKLISNSKINLGGIKPTINVETIQMEVEAPKKPEEQIAKKKDKEKEKVPTEPKIWAKDWFEWASRWGNAFGLITAVIIFSIILLTLFKKYKELQEQLATKNQEPKKEEPPQNNEEAKNEPKEKNESELSEMEDVMAATNGFTRFQQYLLQHPQNAVNLVREWLSIQDYNSLRAVRAISQLAETKEVEFIMAQLSDSQKESWNAQLSEHLTSSELTEINKFIFNEVVRSLLIPSTVKDGETLNLIMEHSPKSMIEFLEEFQEHVPLMMNILGPGLLSKILDQLTSDQTSQWLLQGSSFKTEDTENQTLKLKKDLKEFSQTNNSPFAKRIMELLPKTKFDKEASLLTTLAQSVSESKFEEFVSKFTPAQVIELAPSSMVKEILNSFAGAKKIEILATRSDELKDHLLDCLAAKESTARELLEMEIDDLKKNKIKFEEVSSRQNALWQDYVNSARLLMVKNSTYQEVMLPYVKNWIKTVRPNLKLASNKMAA